MDKHDLKRAECSFYEVNVFIAQREFVNVKMWGRGGGNLNISVRTVLGGRVWGGCVFSDLCTREKMAPPCTHCALPVFLLLQHLEVSSEPPEDTSLSFTSSNFPPA